MRPEQLRERRLYWKRTTCRNPCAMCGETDGTKLQGHHVISQQHLRREARARGIDEDVLLWDERVGMSLCETCHNRHESRFAPVPYEKLTEAHLEFAEEMGLVWLLENCYPKAPAG